MIEQALARVPEADLRVGDLQFLPYEDGAFDVVTAFNSFWFAADPIAALREFRRVTLPGGKVLLLVFGRPERCQLGPAIGAVTALLPEPPREQVRLPPAGHAGGDGVGRSAPAARGRTGSSTSWSGPTPTRSCATCSPPARSCTPSARSGEPAVREAIVDAMAPFRTPDGGYRLENEWRYLIAAA